MPFPLLFSQIPLFLPVLLPNLPSSVAKESSSLYQPVSLLDAGSEWNINKTQLYAPFPHVSLLQRQPIRALPGSLDKIPVLHSNNPEVIQNEGILVSTLSSLGRDNPYAHLGFAFRDRFDIFTHHIAKVPETKNRRNLYLGVLLHNPGKRAITVKIISGSSYLTDPDALFIDLPSQVEDPKGEVYAGPGSRVMVDLLRNRRQAHLPQSITIPAQQSRMLINKPIPLRRGTTINGSSTYLKLQTSGKVYAASLTLFGRKDSAGKERAPTLAEWEKLAQQGALATPRDRIPTFKFDDPSGRHIYSRVAGVAEGSEWKAELAYPPKSGKLPIPQSGQAFSYPLSTLDRGTLGTQQIQSASMLARYADTAVDSQGNYGVNYHLTLPLYNPTNKDQTVAIALQTPLKAKGKIEGLQFLDPPPKNIFFRGPVKVSYPDNSGRQQTRFFHLVQRRGEQGKPLISLTLPPNAKRNVTVELRYPADSTPPQVLTVKTL